jgi:hypothetical protein
LSHPVIVYRTPIQKGSEFTESSLVSPHFSRPPYVFYRPEDDGEARKTVDGHLVVIGLDQDGGGRNELFPIMRRREVTWPPLPDHHAPDCVYSAAHLLGDRGTLLFACKSSSTLGVLTRDQTQPRWIQWRTKKGESTSKELVLLPPDDMRSDCLYEQPGRPAEERKEEGEEVVTVTWLLQDVTNLFLFREVASGHCYLWPFDLKGGEQGGGERRYRVLPAPVLWTTSFLPLAELSLAAGDTLSTTYLTLRYKEEWRCMMYPTDPSCPPQPHLFETRIEPFVSRMPAAYGDATARRSQWFPAETFWVQ